MSEKGEDAINTILAKIGVPGKYQIFTFLCTFTIGIISAFQTVGLAFIQADVSYRCAEENANSTYLTPDSDNVFNNTCFVGDNSSTSTECEQFIYDQSIFKSTITSEFDLVCSRARLVTVSNLVYNGVGIICGIFTGWLSDKIGRKPCIILHLAIIGVVGTITAFSVSMEMYIILKVIMSAPTVGLYDATNSHLSECTAPAKRPHMLIGSVISWGVAILLMSGLGYLIRDWKHLQLVISAPCLLIALLAFWGYDESPHWLYSQGKFEESQKVIEKIARWNKYDLEDFSVISGKVKHGESSQKVSTIELKDESNNASNISVEFTGEENEMTESSKHGCLQILKSGRFMLIFLICSFAWFSCNIGYYGLLYGIGDLVGDLYVNNTLGGVAEIIAYCLCFVILKGGRKYVYVGLGIIGGVSLIGSAIFTIYLPGKPWSIITLTMVGRLCLSSAWQVMYVWCIELFPTSARTTMIQSSLTFGHIGSTLGPFMADLEKVITNPSINISVASPFTYGSLFVISGLSALYLPETSDRPLPVTISDAITMSKRKVKNEHES